MPNVGDRVRVEFRKVDQATREGVMTGVSGALLCMRWSTGEESPVIPGPGSLAVIGKVRKSTSKKAAAPANRTAERAAKPAKKTTKRPTG